MMDRCAIYVRVSSEEQVQGTSLGSQEAACRAFALRHGWEVAQVFVELGESAKTADRTEFQKLIRFATARGNLIRRVVVWKLDRFARQDHDFVVFRALLAKAGVSIVSATEPAGDGPAGKMMQTVLAAIAQLDNEVRAERSRTAMETLARDGYWCHRAPVGFRMARTDGKPVLVASPPASDIIASIFTEIAARRLSVADALRFARERGLTTLRGGAFAIQTLHELLRAPVYAGRIRSDLTRGAMVRARFQGLVSVDTWDRVQLVLGGRSTGVEAVPLCPPRKSVRDEFPLRGLIFCGCGSPFTASWSRGRSGRYGYYHCKHNCPGSRARIEVVHEQFRDVLREISTTHAPLMAAFREIVTRVHARDFEARACKRNAAGQRVELLRRKNETLLEKLLDGTITDAAYRAKAMQIETEMTLARVEAHDDEVETLDASAALSLAEHLLNDLATIWDRAGAQDRLRFERAIFPDGISWSKSDQVRTAATASIFAVLRSCRLDNSVMASPTGCSSNRSPIDLLRACASLEALIRAA